jgi:hypothetical protein
MRHRRLISIVLGSACLLLGLPSVAKPVGEPDTGVPLDAIWRLQEFNFQFRAARGHFHSCSSLQSKISTIMEAIGAGSVIVKLGCNPRELTDNTFATVAAAMPQEATPENVRAATTFDSRQELVARMRQINLPTENDIVRFQAEWRTVSIMAIRGIHLGAEDCSLLEDLSDQIFPHLSVRVVRQRFNCGDAMVRPARPIFVVQALVPREA